MSDYASQLQAELEESLTTSARRRQARQWAEQQEAEVLGNAASEDGGVRATVDRGGMLLDLKISPMTLGQDPDMVADRVRHVVRKATADARTRVRQVYTSLQSEGLINNLPRFLLDPPVVDEEALAGRAAADPPSRYDGSDCTDGSVAYSVRTHAGSVHERGVGSSAPPRTNADVRADDDGYFDGFQIMRGD